MYKAVSIFLFFSLGLAYQAEGRKEDIVIINSNKSKIQNVVAPAIVPSKSAKLRSARQDAELETESSIIKKLETQRLKDEQKRYNKLFDNSSGEGEGAAKQMISAGSAAQTSQNNYFSNWLNRAFLSVGSGFVTYPRGALNLNKGLPAAFFSFGGYGHGNFIFDTSVYYSKPCITPVDNGVAVSYRQCVHQPSLSMSVKLSPLKGRIKPYIGGSGAIIARYWHYTDKEGKEIKSPFAKKDVGTKKDFLAADIGVALGADIALANKLGLNVDLRFYTNVYTETRKQGNNPHVGILDEKDSVVLSVNLRYYL